jgi:hypothetical protein
MIPKKKRAYLVSLEYVDNVSTYERRLIDHEAWTFLHAGGDPPEKVFNDTRAMNPEGGDPYNALTLNDEDTDDEEVCFRMRCFAVHNSSFFGEYPDTSDINGLIRFVAKHDLTIVDECMADDNW